jgi:hypothetical protein
MSFFTSTESSIEWKTLRGFPPYERRNARLGS